MTAIKLLKQYFGYDSFRQGQETLISASLDNSDVLGIMPTGAGKSICYQIPAMIHDGITLVISPLISLMHDQVKTLIQAGIPAAYINSTLSPRQVQLALQNAKSGKYKLIYVAPERLLSSEFLDFAMSVNISMLTIDEAHCISQWGQDFRPSYVKIPEFIERLNKRPVISAFTATATSKVEQDIITSLDLKDPVVLVTGFNRENLYFEVDTPKNKINALMEFLKDYKDKSGIIYCTTRKNVEEVCEMLNNKGFSATRYHAGLPDLERRQNQEDFIYDRTPIIVATNAFGMGIDKSNVSFVVHYNMPKDLESYYQEAGRAGRDGNSAKCILFYSGQDVRTNQWMIENTKGATYEDNESDTILKNQEYQRLKEMTFYSTTNQCLRSFILKYFGETPPSYCGFCSNCDTKFETIDITIDAKKIISCIHRMKENFGATMVIDVLRGSKNERILSLGLNTLSTYNISEKSIQTLRAIIDHLLQDGYLKQSDGQYAVLQLTKKSYEMLKDDMTITMQLPKEKIKTEESRKTDLPENRQDLYERLKAIRFIFSKEQNVPSFMIFSDSSLVDMCIKLPRTSAVFKGVSGVGETKLLRYGTRFINEIIKYCTEKGVVSSILNDEVYTKKIKGKKELNVPSEDILKEIEITDNHMPLSVITSRINEVLLANDCTKITSVKIGDWLVHKGLLEILRKGNNTSKIPTKQGFDCEILQEERGSENKYFVNLYPYNLQKYIVDNITEILELSSR